MDLLILYKKYKTHADLCIITYDQCNSSSGTCHTFSMTSHITRIYNDQIMSNLRFFNTDSLLSLTGILILKHIRGMYSCTMQAFKMLLWQLMTTCSK